MGSSVTQKEVSPDFWNHDSVKSNLPTILPYTFLFHLLNPSSISYSRRYYPSHLSYPTFPSSYQDDEVYPKPAARGVQPQPAAARGVQLQPAAVRGIQPQPSSRSWSTTPSSSRSWCTAPASSSPWCTAPAISSPWCTVPASSSQWCTATACRAGGRKRGPWGGGEEKKDRARFGVFHGWKIPPLAAISSQATWQPAQSRIYCTFS